MTDVNQGPPQRPGGPPGVVAAEVGMPSLYQPLANMEHPLTEADGMRPGKVTNVHDDGHVDLILDDGTPVVHILWGWPLRDHTDAGYGYALPVHY